DRRAVHDALHVLVRQRRGARLVLGNAAAHRDARPDLAVDLYHELDRVRRGLRRVVDRPVAALDPFEADALGALEDALWVAEPLPQLFGEDRKSTRLNSSHVKISYAVFCLK